MKEHDKRMLFKIALGLGVVVCSSRLCDLLLNVFSPDEIACHIGIIPSYKMGVPTPKLKMNKNKATDTDNVLLRAKKEGLDTLGLTEKVKTKKNHN